MKKSKLTRRHSILAVPLAILAAFINLLAAPSAFAVTYYWDNDGTTPGFGTAAGTWAVPTTGDATQGWSTDATGGTLPVNVTTTTNDSVFFGIGLLGLASGTITVSSTVEVNSLTFATNSGAITLNGGTIAFGGTVAAPQLRANNTGHIVNSALRLDTNTSVLMGTAATLALTLNGQISGSGNLTISTPNTIFNNADQAISLGAASTYAGNTTITTGNQNNRLRVKNSSGVADALPVTTVLTLDGGNGTASGRNLYYDLNSQSQTLAGLVSIPRTLRSQQILNTGAGAVTLTISNTANFTFQANISGSGISVVKAGTGTQTFTRTNTYNGTTTINEGNLQFEVGARCANSTVILNATTATNGISITDNTKVMTCAAFTAAAAGVMEFNFGAVTPSISLSPFNVIGAADFSAATPKVRVVTTGIPVGSYPLMTWGSTSGTAPATADLTVDVLAPLTAATLSIVGNTLYLDISSVGGSVVKDNNTTNLNLGTSWVGGVAPNSTKVAKWDVTVTSANTTVLGGDVAWAGIEILDPTGLVTIDNGNTLTLGGASTNIDLSAAMADLTLNCGVALGFANIWDVQAGRTLTVAGAVSGAGTNSLTTQNAGTVILSSGANSYSGNTTVAATSTLKLGAANVIPNGDDKGIVTVSGTLDLNAFSEALNGLSGAGTVDTVTGGTPTLLLGSTNDSATFTGIIQNTAGTLSLTKTNTGRQDLTGVNTLSGSVSVNQGWLAVGANNTPLANVSSITVADGATFGAYDTEVIIDAPITLGAGNPTITIAAGVAPLTGGANTAQRPLRLNGGITGTGNVVFQGVNPFNWMGAIYVSNCTYTGSTLITCLSQLPGFVNLNSANVVVRLLGDNALPTNTVVTMDGNNGAGSGRFCDINMAGFSQTIAGLTNITRSLRNQRIINPGVSAPANLTVNNTADYSFSGFIGATSGGLLSAPGNNLGLIKNGSGTFTLAKASGNTYTNGTTINGGTLLVNNTTGSGTGTGDVNVNSGGTLGGTGIIAGIVTNNSGGTLAPGASIGTLTLNGNVVLNAGSTNTFEVDGTTATNDVVVLGSTVTYGGVLKIVPTGTITNGQTFTLFSGAGATDPSNFGGIVVSPAVSGTSFTFTNGILTAVVAPVGPSGPGSITNSYSGGVLSLSWPAGQGWRLQQQTNSLSVGLNTNWIYLTDGTLSSTNITVDSANPTVFYRLTYP